MSLDHHSHPSAAPLPASAPLENSSTIPARHQEKAPLLEMAGIEKTFPGVRALKNARLDLRAGEVHALLGENGAGKSTLIKVLAGAHQPDAGILRINGVQTRIRSPHHARLLGIAVIYQEFTPERGFCDW
jgi:ABC-type sugar transport system ATPase subunit